MHVPRNQGGTGRRPYRAMLVMAMAMCSACLASAGELPDKAPMSNPKLVSVR